jgi:hypothetical protein
MDQVLQSYGIQSFMSALIYNGQPVQHEVYDAMPIVSLMEDAGQIFGLDPNQIVLMLFSAVTTTLDRHGVIAGPPRLVANATVFVFAIHAPTPTAQQRGFAPVPPASCSFGASPFPQANAMVSSKLLGSFKLPKFDGSPRHWKTWDRSLQRFLGLHQLDHVLLDVFVSLLPHPDAVNANKVVYFLIEEAVDVGTLAAKHVRQAPKWNGHEAYLLLYNRFVFSGAQTATILLAELYNIRLNCR